MNNVKNLTWPQAVVMLGVLALIGGAAYMGDGKLQALVAVLGTLIGLITNTSKGSNA